MKYTDILIQWDEVMKNVGNLQDNIEICINENGFSSEHEEQDLKIMHKACYEIFAILLGYLS